VVENQQPSSQNRFSFPAASRLKNLKLQFQQPNAQQSSSQSQSNNQQIHSQKQQCLIDSIMNMLCTALVESQTKDLVQKWLNKLECFMRYIMILGETMSQSKSEPFYSKVQNKFANVITYGFAFLFNQIHSSNYQQTSPTQTQNLQIGGKKLVKLQTTSQLHNKMSINSNSSSPKDYQATTRLFSLTLKNLIIHFVNIVDYK
jgi:hypothetical protein